MNAQAEKISETATPPALTPAAYNTLVAAARLRDLRLLKADFSLDPDGIGGESDWKLTHTCEIQKAEYNSDAEVLLAFVDAAAICKIKNKKVVVIRCRYLVAYDVQGQPEAAAVDAFAKRVARFTAYPYFRAHVAEVGSQAGLRLPPLPIIKEVKIIPKISAPQEPAAPPTS